MELNQKEDSFQSYFFSEEKDNVSTVGKKVENEGIIVREDVTLFYKKLSFQYGSIAVGFILSAIGLVYFTLPSDTQQDDVISVEQVTASQHQQDFNQLQSAEEQIKALRIQGVRLINENTEKNNQIAELRLSLAESNRHLNIEKERSHLSATELQRLKTTQITDRVNQQQSISSIKSGTKKGTNNPLSGISINSVYSGHAWILSGNQTYAVKVGDKFKGMTILGIDAQRNRVITTAGVIE